MFARESERWYFRTEVNGYCVVLDPGGMSIVGKGWSYTSPTRPPKKKPSKKEMKKLVSDLIVEYEGFVNSVACQ